MIKRKGWLDHHFNQPLFNLNFGYLLFYACLVGESDGYSNNANWQPNC